LSTGIAAGWFECRELLAVGQRKRRVARPARAPFDPKRQRIAISTWSFHNYFQPTRSADFSLPGRALVLLDFPEMVADQYKVHNLEFVAPHFSSFEPAYLLELKSRLKRTRSRLVNIPVDIEELRMGGGLSDSDAKIRATAVTAVKKWIDVGRQLGARSVRCDPGKMDPQNLGPTVKSYKELSAYGRSKGVYVIVENHGGVGSEHPEELVALFKGVGGNFIGALPDFGNFPDESIRLRGLPLLFPYARTVCHAKGLEFDPSGNETKFDFKRCVKISKEAKYKGVYSIEYEGPGDPYEGVQKVVDELLRFL
jgi:sugar phosphate isomerase/epimerase